MNVLTIIDLQEEFDSFTHRTRVVREVARLVKTGAYDYIVNLMYGGGHFGQDEFCPSPNIPEVKRILRGKKNVLQAVKTNDGGGREVLNILSRNIAKKKAVEFRGMKIDIVGVNTPYCVAETVYDLTDMGVKPENIRVHVKAVSEGKSKRHKRDRQGVLREFEEMGVELVA